MTKHKYNYQSSIIKTFCESMDFNKKQLMKYFGVTSKTIENYINNKDTIPEQKIVLMNLCINNRKLENEIERLNNLIIKKNDYMIKAFTIKE